MNQFDIDAFLGNRFDAASQKLKAVEEASRRKQEELAQLSTIPDPQEGTWVNKLNLDRHGTTASVVNAVGSLASGASRLAGNVAALPSAIQYSSQASELPQEVIAAFDSERKGVATPAEKELLDYAPQGRGSYRDQVGAALKSSQAVRNINEAFDISKVVDSSKQAKLQEDLEQGFTPHWEKVTNGDAWDKVAGIAGLLSNAGGAILNNKEAVLQHVLQNLPQLAVGMLGGPAGPAALGVANAGYAVDLFHQGVSNYAKKNNGALPSQEQLDQMARDSALAGAAEYLGDAATLGAGKAFGKLGLAGKGAKNAATAAEKELARTSLKQALLNTGKAALGSAATEAPTEGYQTYLEGEITGSPASAADIYSGAVIGAASAGHTTTALRGAHEAGALWDQSTKQTEAKAANAPIPSQPEAVNKATEAAIQTGNIDEMLDYKSKSFSPENAIAALVGHSQANPDKAQENLAKADAAMEALGKQRDNLKSSLRDPEEINRAITEYETLLATPGLGDADKDLLTKLVEDERISLEKRDANLKRYEYLEAAMKKAEEAYQMLQAEADKANPNAGNQPEPKAADLVQKVRDSKSQEDTDDAIDGLVTLAMANPGAVDADVLKALADDKSLALSELQRHNLRIVSDARLAENKTRSLGAVNEEIFKGSDKNIGIAQYQERMAQALKRGNIKLASRQLQGIQEFQASHQSKAEAIQKAWDAGSGTKIVRATNGTWSIATGDISDAALSRNSGLTASSQKLVDTIQAEAAAITAAANQMQAAFDLKFKTKPTQKAAQAQSATPKKEEAKAVKEGAQHVQNVPQQGAKEAPRPTAAQVQAKQEVAPGKAGAGKPDAGAKAPGSSQVEGAGVTSSDGSTATTTEKTSVPPVEQLTEKPEASKTTTTADKVEGIKESTQEDTTTRDNPDTTTQETVDEEQQTPTEDAQQEPDLKAGAVQGRALPALQEGEQETYFNTNLITKHLKQSPGRKNASSLRPLVVVKDFLGDSLSGFMQRVTGFLPEGQTLTGAQKKTLAAFARYADQWEGDFNGNLVASDSPQYYYNQLLQFIMQLDDGRPYLEQNTTVAMSYAIFTSVAENSSRFQRMDDEGINRLIGRADNHPVTEEERAALGIGLSHANILHNRLGMRAMRVLGFTASKGAPANILPQLAGELGAHIARQMETLGLLQRRILTKADLMAYASPMAQSMGPSEHLTLFAFTKNEVAKNIAKANEGSQGILDALFDSEAELVYPTLEPQQFRQNNVKKSRNKVPQFLAKILNKAMAVKNTVRVDTHKVMTAMTEDGFLDMLLGDAPQQAGLVAAHEAKREGLRREHQNFLGFVDSMMTKDGALDSTTPFYLPWFMGQPQRTFIGTQIVNPQASKIHRHAITRGEWQSTVDMEDPQAMHNFTQRVAEAFGFKSDQHSDPVVIAEKVFDKLYDPVIQDGVTVLIRLLGNPDKKTLEPSEQEALKKAVQQGGEGMYSLDGLMALAQYEIAVNKGDTTFTTSLLSEVDGVTNGPMLSHLLMGIATGGQGMFSLLNRGGFFSKNDDATQYNEYRSQPGNLDLYQDVTRHIMGSVQQLKGELTKYGRPKLTDKKLAPVNFFFGALQDKAGEITSDGRNFSKKPTTQTVFSSSSTNTVADLGGELITAIYKKIDKAGKVQDARLRAQAMQEIAQNINAMLWESARVAPSDLMELVFSREQASEIQDYFKWSLGLAVNKTMNSYFGEFKERTKIMNQATNLAFAMYDAAFQAMREKKFKELMYEIGPDQKYPEGRIPAKMLESSRNVDGSVIRTLQPLHDLSNEQLDEIREQLRPMEASLSTYMSKQDKWQNAHITGGLSMAKTTESSQHQAMYTSEVKFAHALNKQARKNTKSYAVVSVDAPPGVKMPVLSVHSADSATSHMAGEDTDSLNNHDAEATGAMNVVVAAQRLNKALYKTVLGYSPVREVSNTLLRTLHGLAQVLKDGKQDPHVIKSILATMEKHQTGEVKVDSTEGLLDMVMGLLNEAYLADKTRLETLIDMAYVNQYAMDGGSYQVTKEDRDEAAEQLKKLKEPKLDERDVAALNSIAKAMGWDSLEKTQAGYVWRSYAQETYDKSQLKEGDAGQDTDRFGELGQSKETHDQELVAFFNENTQPTVKETLDQLMKQLTRSDATPLERLYSKLVYGLSLVLGEDTTIQYVTPTTQVKELKGVPKTSARGWTTFGTNGNHVYILGADFVRSGVTVEAVIHELLHAALYQAINSGLNPSKKGGNYAASALVKELQQLREEAIKHASNIGEGGNPHFAAALGLNGVDETTALHEFVSWGMTNLAFQEKILGTFGAESGNQDNPLVRKTLGQQFLAAVVKWWHRVTGQSSKHASTGMEVLMTNVAGLFARAQDMREAPTKTAEQQTNEDPAVLHMANVHEAIDGYSTTEIYDALGQSTAGVSGSMDAHLRNVLASIVERVHGVFGSLKQSKIDAAATAEGMWHDMEKRGRTPLASAMAASPLPSTKQEQFVAQQVEATVQELLTRGETFTSLAYRDLARLYQHVRASVKPQDFHNGSWDQATPAEKDIAQQQHDFLFDMGTAAGERSEYLSRFAALGMANQRVREILAKVQGTLPEEKTKDGWAARLEHWFNNLLRWVSNQVNHTTKDMAADQRLDRLVDRLVSLEQGHKESLKKRASRMPLMDRVDARASEWLVNGIGKGNSLLESSFFKNSKVGLLKGGASLARMVLADRVDTIAEAAMTIRDRQMDERHGVLASLVQEVRHPSDMLKKLMRLVKKNEQHRMNITQHTASSLLREFADAGQTLSQEDKAALSASLLRTGMHHALGTLTMQQMEVVLADDKALQAEIVALEDRLPSAVAGDLIHAAKELGYFRATGRNTSQMLMLNAHNIVQRDAKGSTKEVTDSVATLVALYGLKYSKGVDRSLVQKVLARENQRGQESNGVEFMLRMHKRMEQESLQKLFRGNPTLMVHGFLPEITNPDTVLEFANSEQGAYLAKQGYALVGGELPRDMRDPSDEPRHLYVLKDAGNPAYVSGAISLENQKAKGHAIHSGFTYLGSAEGVENAQANAHVLKASNLVKGRSLGQARKFDPTSSPWGFMAPVLNENGGISTWRYFMEERHRDTLLERNNDFSHLLGTMMGAITGKPEAKAQNETVVQTLYDQYRADYAKDPSRFIEVSPNSTDPEMRDLWDMLPKDTKDTVQGIWGRKGLQVRKDAVDILFGYKKLSAANIFRDANNERKQREEMGMPKDLQSLESINAVQKAAVYFVEQAFVLHARVNGASEQEAKDAAMKAAAWVARTEKGWQEIVAGAKNTIVVKSVSVLLGNEFSNLSLLKLSGVPFKDILRHRYVATRGAVAYIADTQELGHVNALLATQQKPGQRSELLREKRRLEDAIHRNPVRELIDAGLMPSIVEDISQVQNPYSYKSRLERTLSEKTSNVPKSLRNAAKQFFLTEDTEAYKFLSRSTQLSDFVARYTLYQYLTTKAHKPMSKDAAIQRAADSFVNYDLPMHRMIQAAEDSGLLMFSKYFLRIQREIQRLFRERPASVLSLVVADQFLDLDYSLLRSHWPYHLGNNPVQSGAFEYLDGLKSLPTVSGAMALVQ